MTWEHDQPVVDGEIHGYTIEEVHNLVTLNASLSEQCRQLADTINHQRNVIAEALTVLHRTSVSKRAVADRMRACLGLKPGQSVKDRVQ